MTVTAKKKKNLSNGPANVHVPVCTERTHNNFHLVSCHLATKGILVHLLLRFTIFFM